MVGALAYNFSDSFWFSAVEGEVYGMSQLCTAFAFWIILKWESVADQPHNERWIVLIAYTIGLSIGVHLLNLLTIPAIVFIYYFKNFKVTQKGFIITLVLSVLMLGGILNGIIPGIINMAANYEIFFVNKFGLPFNSGTVVYFGIILAIILVGIKYTHSESEKLFTYLMILMGVFVV